MRFYTKYKLVYTVFKQDYKMYRIYLPRQIVLRLDDFINQETRPQLDAKFKKKI